MAEHVGNVGCLAALASARRGLGIQRVDRRARPRDRGRRGRLSWATSCASASSSRSAWSTPRFSFLAEKLSREAKPMSPDIYPKPSAPIRSPSPSRRDASGAAAASCRRSATMRASSRCSAAAARSTASASSARERSGTWRATTWDRMSTASNALLAPGHGFGLGFCVRLRIGARADHRKRRRLFLGRRGGNDIPDLAARLAVRDFHGAGAGQSRTVWPDIRQSLQRRDCLIHRLAVEPSALARSRLAPHAALLPLSLERPR